MHEVIRLLMKLGVIVVPLARWVVLLLLAIMVFTPVFMYWWSR